MSVRGAFGVSVLSLASVLGALVAGPVRAQDTGPVITEGFVAAPLRVVWEAWTTYDSALRHGPPPVRLRLVFQNGEHPPVIRGHFLFEHAGFHHFPPVQWPEQNVIDPAARVP